MIRPATLDDRGHFLRLWAKLLEGQYKDGSHVLPTLGNLYRCLDKFEAYVMGSQFGMCVFFEPPEARPVGVVMAGELAVPDEFETDLGKLATLWGVYVEPEYRGQGIALKLFAKTLEMGLERGFESVETYARYSNPHGQRVAEAFGCEPYMKQYVARLRDPRVMKTEEAKKALSREVTHG